MSSEPAARRGPKRGQVVVLLIVLVVVAGILLPATLQACAAAARMRCMNQVHQLAYACLNYENTHRHYPPGTIVESAKVPEDRLGLLVPLCTHIAESARFARFDPKQGWQSDNN